MSLAGDVSDDAGFRVEELEALLGLPLVPVTSACQDVSVFESSECITGQAEPHALDCVFNDLPWDECFTMSSFPDTLDGLSASDLSLFSQPLPTLIDEVDASKETPNKCCPQPRKRLSMKNRIELLKEQTTQLKFELKAAQLKSQALTTANTATGDSAAHERAQQQLLKAQAIAVWEAVASRQLRLREKAERENVRLRTLVHAQHRYLRSVGNLLKKRPHQQEVDAVASRFNVVTVPRGMLGSPSRSATIQDMMDRLNHEYTRLDHLWKDIEMEGLVSPARKCLAPRHVVQEETRVMYIERTNVPFAPGVVGRATWDYLQNPRLWRAFVRDAKNVIRHGDTIQVSSTGVEVFSGRKASFTMTSVSSKFVERERTVFMTFALIESCVEDDVAISGVKFPVVAARVVKPDGLLPSGERSTVVELVRNAHALDIDGVTKCPTWKFEPYIDLGISTMDGTLTHEHQAIEDLALQLQRATVC